MAHRPSATQMYAIYTTNFAKKTYKLFAMCPEKDVDFMLKTFEECEPRLEFEIDMVEDLLVKFPAKAKGVSA